jgi:hypothetical protein
VVLVAVEERVVAVAAVAAVVGRALRPWAQLEERVVVAWS